MLFQWSHQWQHHLTDRRGSERYLVVTLMVGPPPTVEDFVIVVVTLMATPPTV